MRLELSHRRSGLWACSKQGVFVNKSKIFVIISRCYGSCENIRVVIFGERLHSPLFRNKRFGELSGFLETLFFFQVSCSIHNTYHCGYILHGWMPYSHLPRWPHGCMMKGSLCHVRLCLISRATTAIKARKIIRSLTWDADPSSYSHVVMWGKWLYGIQPWSISCHFFPFLFS